MFRHLLPLLAQAPPGGDAPWWLTAIVTPAVGFWLLATGHLRWGKGVDRDIAAMAERIGAAEARAKESDERAERAQDRERATLSQVLPVLASTSSLIDRAMDRAKP